MARRPGTGTNRSVRRDTYTEIDNVEDSDLAAGLRTALVTGRPELYHEAMRQLRVDEDDEETVESWLSGELNPE